MRSALEVTFALLVGASIFVACLGGCQPPKTPTEAAAEATYGGELQKCVAENDTAADIDACANDVRRRWSTKDGGAR